MTSTAPRLSTTKTISNLTNDILRAMNASKYVISNLTNDRLRGMNAVEHTTVTFIDFSKTFDNVNYDILSFQKLEGLGIRLL